MSSFIKEVIAFTLMNFVLVCFCAGLICALVAIAWRGGPATPAKVVDRLLGWHVFWSIGVSYLVNFVFHAFFGGLAARFIGWADSPFQFEVATASLGFAAVGFVAAWRSFDLRLAAVLGPGLFTLGAAAGHVRQMVTTHNFAPGNAGSIFYADIFVPLFGFGLLWWARRSRGDAGALDIPHEPARFPQSAVSG
ncbi:MAG: DUF6790 family protein [Caulobacteraceae bacterium]